MSDDIYSQYSFNPDGRYKKSRRKRPMVFIVSLILLLVAVGGGVAALYLRGFNFGSMPKGNANGDFTTPEMSFYTVEVQGINKKTDAVAASYDMIALKGAGYLANAGENWTLVDGVYLASSDATRRMAERAATGDETNTVLNKYIIAPKKISKDAYTAVISVFNKLAEVRTDDTTLVANNLYLELKDIKPKDTEVKHLLNQCILALYNLSYKAVNTEHALASIIFSLYNF